MQPDPFQEFLDKSNLATACLHGNVPDVQAVLSRNPDLDLNDINQPVTCFPHSKTGSAFSLHYDCFNHETLSGALLIAVAAGHSELVAYLLEHHLDRLDCRAETAEKLNAVELCSLTNHLSTMRVLLRWHLHFELDRAAYQNPLKMALLHGHHEIARLLLEVLTPKQPPCGRFFAFVRCLNIEHMRMSARCSSLANVDDCIRLLMDHPKVVLDCGLRLACQQRHCQDLVYNVHEDQQVLIMDHPRFPGFYPGCFGPYDPERNQHPITAIVRSNRAEVLDRMLLNRAFLAGDKGTQDLNQLEQDIFALHCVGVSHGTFHRLFQDPAVGRWLHAKYPGRTLDWLARMVQYKCSGPPASMLTCLSHLLASATVFTGPLLPPHEQTLPPQCLELLQSYAHDPRRVAGELRRAQELPHPVALLYIHLWAWNNGLLQLQSQSPSESWDRILLIFGRLPTELRMVLCNRVAGYSDFFVSECDVATAFEAIKFTWN